MYSIRISVHLDKVAIIFTHNFNFLRFNRMNLLASSYFIIFIIIINCCCCCLVYKLVQVASYNWIFVWFILVLIEFVCVFSSSVSYLFLNWFLIHRLNAIKSIVIWKKNCQKWREKGNAIEFHVLVFHFLLFGIHWMWLNWENFCNCFFFFFKWN